MELRELDNRFVINTNHCMLVQAVIKSLFTSAEKHYRYKYGIYSIEVNMLYPD